MFTFKLTSISVQEHEGVTKYVAQYATTDNTAFMSVVYVSLADVKNSFAVNPA